MDNFNASSFKSLRIKETPFRNLMQKRIFNVLLIATPYDAFMMEEDGRVEEQIYFEYANLNLSSPPRFTKVANYEEAYPRLLEQQFDLIIAMPGVDVSETFEQAKRIDALYPQIPFVVLTPFSHEVSRRLASEDLSGVDYVFSWLGNVELILAIIKLIEDRMNTPQDVGETGVRMIMLIEDSVRFYSSMLPHLYKYLLKQSLLFSTEALNDHERMLRMRGRPKIVLARNYEEAEYLFGKYGDKMLGIISDVRFPLNGVKNAGAGLEFARFVRERDPYIPIIFESSELANRRPVEDFGSTFLYKNAQTFPQDLVKSVSYAFGFGDFVVRDPATGQEVMRLHNLKDLQKNVFNIPADALYSHCSKNDFSRWLYARALFAIGDTISNFRFTDMRQAPAVRQTIFESIVKYRRLKNRGVVAIFQKDRFDRYSNFARIGQGSLGGKARGLAFIDQIIKRNSICDDFHGVQISIPRTVVLCTDVFDEFMETNNLYPVALSDIPDAEILKVFLQARLPEAVRDDLAALLDVMETPMAVRSSSLLEDSHYQPFAGVYATYMIPHLEDRKAMLRQLTDAIKGVYASVFYADSKAYMTATRNVIDQEKMAVILQEVVGMYHDGLYYPSFSGVGRSLNYYPLGNETSEDGVAEVAVGLGKYIVDGGMALRFSPLHPRNVLQTSTLDLALRDTQTSLYALPATTGDNFSTDDSFNIVKVQVNDAAKTGALRFMVSTFDVNDRCLRDTDAGPGRKVVTFANVLNHDVFPLADAVDFMLKRGQYEMGRPVEIEFAGMISPDAMRGEEKGRLYWLQMRPIVDRKEMLDDKIMDRPDSELLLRSNTALGHGLMEGVKTVVYVKPQNFDSRLNPELAKEVEQINARLSAADTPYILVAPGRWGSSDPALGIPVKWAQIAGARLIVETAIPGYRIEPSQGTHFFQNLTSFGVGYFTVDPSAGNGFFDSDYLDAMPADYESEHIRIVSFKEPLTIAINGRKTTGIVSKPGSGNEQKDDFGD